MKKTTWLLLLLIVWIGSNERIVAQTVDTNILVGTEWLEQNMEKEIHLIDVRVGGYQTGHIPGAVHMPIDLIEDKKHPIRGYLVGKVDFENIMRDHGVRTDDTIVIYDKGGDTAATRLFYALEYYGHLNVKVLDGGFAAWEAAEKKITTEMKKVQLGDFKAIEKSELRKEKTEVKEAIGEEGVILLDVRSTAEYLGEDVRAKRGGHIPTAVNLEWKNVLRPGEVALFKSRNELVSLLEAVGVTKDKTIIIYCQRANRASHMYFTLRLLGYDKVSVYEGSWEEWGNVDDTPIVNPSE
ncbi:sulfurtransferase [Halalkalibacter krulwichiae]|uniref:Sulfurtransferase n=1 Tax=Halalkalibacter krulwichiae TaxID=199441 RepID=A0A1X9MEI3_9BACI|nr:sulfurtransferase [Halalkalibacter krulwichiae]ARK31826.1 Thiosulfate sulfurtransferase [Halalkalibacter krulwichiae]